MKLILRREMLLKRSGQSAEAMLEKSKLVEARVLSLPEWAKARTIMFYAATRSEVQTRVLIEDALRQGKKACLPGGIGEERHVDAYYINSYGDLVLGDLGFLEPIGRRKAERDGIDLVIVPGLAFDEKGNRLGRGLHYYDSFLAGLKARKVGLAFELQIVESVPSEPHDVPVDKIVTEKRVINCR